MNRNRTYQEILKENEFLQAQLEETQDIINAIKMGEVDAFIVKNKNSHELYTLKTADQTYRLFIEKMTDGALTINKEGIILYANSSFEKMVNQPTGSVIGLSFHDFIPEQFKIKVAKCVDYSWTKECRCEIFLPGQDKQIPVLMSMNKLEIENETALSIIITDLSFQKEAQQQRMALDRKDEFISIASHELKTPVTTIKGYIQLLQMGYKNQADDNTSLLLSRADAQVTKLTRLIEDLLDVKKIETGQLAFHIEDFSFNDLILETVEEMSRGLSVQKIIYHPGMDCIIEGDRLKIAQVITNLIGNASKYSSSETTIYIKTVITGNRVRFYIKDEGIGIPPDQQDRVFERFFRVKTQGENTYSGMGLGLYICSDIIKRHKGTVGFESEINKGSVFYFELTIKK